MLPADPQLPDFFEHQGMGPRDWGEEIQVALSPGKWMLKIIRIRKGCKGGLQYHRLKDEGGLVVKGELLLKYYCPVQRKLLSNILRPGDSFRFPQRCIHQEEALTDVEIIEVSTPHLNDRVRCESVLLGDNYVTGLPTTAETDIIML